MAKRILKESDYERKINSKIRQLGVWCNHIETNIPGFPDTIVIGGRTIFIEYKVATAKDKVLKVFEPAQLKFHYEAIYKNGGLVCSAVIDKNDPYSIIMVRSYKLFEYMLLNLEATIQDAIYEGFTEIMSYDEFSNFIYQSSEERDE